MNEIQKSDAPQISAIPVLLMNNDRNSKMRKNIKLHNLKRIVMKNKFIYDSLKGSFKEIKQGRWEESEHQKFISACLTYGNDWKKVIY